MKRKYGCALFLLITLHFSPAFSQLGSLTDIDDDNDGILDIVENRGYDAFGDCDGDGTVNYLDSSPGCSTPAGNDVYGRPFISLTWQDCNSDGINDFFDWDRDGVMNELDLDSDNDGIVDLQESRDARILDMNKDGMADGVDNDGDGLMASADANENSTSTSSSKGLRPRDMDRDGKPNYLDLDSDADGIADNREALQLDAFAGGYIGLTSGMNDNDGDGVRTINYTNNINDADNYIGFGAKGIIILDNDGDGCPNPYDIDSDNDGITDNVEGQPTCSYIEPSGEDADEDGLDDAYDFDKGACARKASGITPYDKEYDGTPDIRDLDTDNDGAPDVNEGSGIYYNFVTEYTDKDQDGLIDQFDTYDLNLATNRFNNNVCHNEMGAGGNRNGPVPAGSMAPLPQMMLGECPSVDRDWRNVAILPVSLISFKASFANKNVKLIWIVQNEVNMSHYIIERSFNGLEFVQVSKVMANGNNALTTSYSYNDLMGLNSGTVYYRLREFDKNGTWKISKVLSIKMNDNETKSVSLFPNPAVSSFAVRINATREDIATIRIIDMAGKVLRQKVMTVSQGVNVVPFDEPKLATGTYHVQVVLSGTIFNQMLINTK